MLVREHFSICLSILPYGMFLGQLDASSRTVFSETEIAERQDMFASIPSSATKGGQPGFIQAARRRIHGGGAENRTPVQSSPLTGVSRLSHQLGLRRRAPDDSRLASQLVQSFPRAYQPRPLEHLPRMTRPRRRKQSPVQRLRY